MKQFRKPTFVNPKSPEEFIKENGITIEQFDRMFAIAEKPITDEAVYSKVQKIVSKKIAKNFMSYLL